MRYRIAFDSEEQFQLARGAATSARASVFTRWKDATEPAEKAFYRQRVDAYDALLAKYDAELVRDISQDPEPDDEED